MVDSDSKDATDEGDDEERDAPTSVAKVSERLLKALKQRNATDEKVVSSAPPAKNDAPTQPPPPPSSEADEDESATNVLLTDKAPIRRAAAESSTAASDEDQSETLYAITAKTGKTPAVPAVKEKPPTRKEEPAEDVGPIASPLAPPPPGYWWWAAPLAVAIGIAALVSWVLLNHG